jgi:nicotinamidase-related amidase
VAMPTVYPAKEIVERAASLARAFRAKQLPVVLVNVAGSAPGRTDAGPFQGTRPDDWAELVPELGAQPDDHRVTKRRWGAFLGTDLDAYLRSQNVTQIVLAGIATSIGVESTARSAYDLGYHVVIVIDAVTDRDADAHKNSVEKLFPRMAETDRTENVLKMLS